MAGGDLVPAAEYGRRINVQKSRMSAWLKLGMPYVDGRDGHGRVCKLVDLAEADAWRMANTEVRVDASGQLRGLDMACDLSREAVKPRPAAPPAGEGDPSLEARPAEAASTPLPSVQIELTPQQLATSRIAEAKARTSEMEAEGKGLLLAQRRGDLIDRAAALEVITGFALGIGAILDRKPAEGAVHVAAELGSTTHKAMLALRKVTDELRAELAQLAGDIARELEGTRR